MANSLIDVFTSSVGASPRIVSGEVVARSQDGQILVDYPENLVGALPARTLVEDLFQGAKVLLAFDAGDLNQPIVLGIIHDRAQATGKTIHIKASRILLEARDELLLRCGEGSITARGGKVDVRGKDVISRATRTNKVRGATVLIN